MVSIETKNNPYWRRALGLLSARLSPAQVETWLSPLVPLRLGGRTARLGCPNRFYQGWLQERYRELITEALADSGLRVEAVEFEVVAAPPGSEDTPSLPALELDRTLTFENFVVGDANRLAYQAARSVVDAPGRGYNPLVICGEVGEGKTHLLHAVGHALLERRPELRVLQLPASRLFERLVEAVQEGRTAELRRELRSTDVLLMDDIHTLTGRPGTQEEFFHSFNALHTAGKQLVLTSRMAPSMLPGLTERIRSRLSWGLVVQLEPGGAGFRLRLAQRSAERLRWPVPAGLLAEFVRPLEVSNRELIGLLLRAAAVCKLTGDSPEAALAEALRSRRGHGPRASLEDICRAACRRLGLSAKEVRGPRRARPLAQARHLIAYLAHNHADFSLPTIGRALGGRDHTTILHGVRKAASLLAEDPSFAQVLRELRRELDL